MQQSIPRSVDRVEKFLRDDLVGFEEELFKDCLIGKIGAEPKADEFRHAHRSLETE